MRGIFGRSAYTSQPSRRGFPARGVVAYLVAIESPDQCLDFPALPQKDVPVQLPSTLSTGRKFVMAFFEHFRKLLLTLTLLFLALGAAGAGIGYAAQNLRDFSLTAHGITIRMHSKPTVHHSKPKTPKGPPPA